MPVFSNSIFLIFWKLRNDELEKKVTNRKGYETRLSICNDFWTKLASAAIFNHWIRDLILTHLYRPANFNRDLTTG